MATFISTIIFTAQGLQGIDETTKRAAALKAAAKKRGVKITNIYWTLGDHDGVLIFEAADDETAAAFLLHVTSQGNVQTSTVRAFTATEMDGIVAKANG
ncbi:MAG: GYD domain-containing protein [Planctomycetota bacterium]|nr:GYD domain-containing protein [Planctomycetota bacterium]